MDSVFYESTLSGDWQFTGKKPLTPLTLDNDDPQSEHNKTIIKDILLLISVVIFLAKLSTLGTRTTSGGYAS